MNRKHEPDPPTALWNHNTQGCLRLSERLARHLKHRGYKPGILGDRHITHLCVIFIDNHGTVSDQRYFQKNLQGDHNEARRRAFARTVRSTMTRLSRNPFEF